MDLNIYCFALSAISHEKKIAKLMVMTVAYRFFPGRSLVNNFYTFLLIKFLVPYLLGIEVFVDFPEIFCHTLCQPKWYDKSEEHKNTPKSAQEHCEEIDCP